MKVSVIVPTYNCGKYVEECLNSILSQTLQDFEILVVDDKSTDDTVQRIKKFDDDRIKLFINKRNMGSAYSRNFAISQAQGEYIAFLDGDDCWLPKKLEEQIAFMESNKYLFSYTNYEEINELGEKPHIRISGPKVISHKKFLRNNYVRCLTVMYKREVFPDLSIPNDIYKRNDYALWLKLSEKCNCYLLNKTFSLYRKGNGISSGKKIKLLKYHKIMFQKLYGYNSFISWIFAYRNAFYLLIKRFRYRRKIK